MISKKRTFNSHGIWGVTLQARFNLDKSCIISVIKEIIVQHDPIARHINGDKHEKKQKYDPVSANKTIKYPNGGCHWNGNLKRCDRNRMNLEKLPTIHRAQTHTRLEKAVKTTRPAPNAEYKILQNWSLAVVLLCMVKNTSPDPTGIALMFVRCVRSTQCTFFGMIFAFLSVFQWENNIFFFIFAIANFWRFGIYFFQQISQSFVKFGTYSIFSKCIWRQQPSLLFRRKVNRMKSHIQRLFSLETVKILQLWRLCALNRLKRWHFANLSMDRADLNERRCKCPWFWNAFEQTEIVSSWQLIGIRLKLKVKSREKVENWNSQDALDQVWLAAILNPCLG